LEERLHLGFFKADYSLRKAIDFIIIIIIVIVLAHAVIAITKIVPKNTNPHFIKEPNLR
jgi:hypothetical protein